MPDLWSGDFTGAERVLNEAFVEYIPTPTAGILPYVGIMTDTDRIYLHRWFHNVARSPLQMKGPPNQRFVIAADRNVVAPSCGTQLGYRPRDSRDSFIFAGTIAGGTVGPLDTFYPTANSSRDEPETTLPSGCAGLTLTGLYGRQASALVIGTAAHEVVHAFNVNGTTADATHDGFGHCRTRVNFTGVYGCLMDERYPASASNAQISGLILNLHFANGGQDSEYMTMRKETDPSQ